MVDNVFMSDAKEITLDDYLGFEKKDGRIWVQSCPLLYIGCWNTP